MGFGIELGIELDKALDKASIAEVVFCDGNEYRVELERVELDKATMKNDQAELRFPVTDGLHVAHLEKRYGHRQIVTDVSFYIRRGEVVGLLGPNGAGKTTSFYMVMGLIRADGGSVRLDGEEISDLPMYRRARMGLGYLPQEASIFKSLSVAENIMAVLEVVETNPSIRELRLAQLLADFDIEHLSDTAGAMLSGGERRRVEIARALASDPQILLLDEPFAGIDPLAVEDIRRLIGLLRHRNIGILITDHNVRETLGLVDRALILHEGRVLREGTADEILSDPQVRRFYLGDNFSIG